MNTKLLAGLVTSTLVFSACTSSSETASRDDMTKTVGIYEPPGPGVVRVRLGVPSFTKGDKTPGAMAEIAADQLSTLCVNTERFDVIERTQLDQLLKEQGLEGIVKGGEMAQPAQVRGVDYLMIGKVTNFRVKAENTSKGFNLGNIPVPGTRGALGLFDIKNQNSKIQVDVGVDLRMVDPTSGSVAAAEFSEYKRVDSIGAMGVSILGANSQATAELDIDEDSQGKILRLALDDCMKKMLRKVDRVLVARAKAQAATQPSGEAK